MSERREKIAEIIRGDFGMPNERLALERADKIIALLPQYEKIRGLLEAVVSSCMELYCEDVEGENWFDLRDKILESLPAPPINQTKEG